jgi:hypothetical protein
MRKLASILSGLAVVVLAGAPGANAGEPAVALGEVTAMASQRDDVDLDALRAMAADAVKDLDDARLPPGAHVVLSVSVVRLESRASTSAEVSCVVSATLRDRARGTVFAILEGSARGQDEPRRLHVLERATLGAAVRSAISRVPEAMTRRTARVSRPRSRLRP